MQPNRVRFLKQRAVHALKDGVGENLVWYRGGDHPKVDKNLADYKSMSKDANWKSFDEINQKTAEKDDLANVMTVYKSFGHLSPQQAADERIWVYATHTYARNYTRSRWNKIPTDDKKAEKYILTHYFGAGARGLLRDNAVSRLWWMGYIASQCNDYPLQQTLKALLHAADVRANLLERSSVSMSAEIFSAIIRALVKSMTQARSGEESKLHQRDVFRSLMKMVNQRGGRIMLNVLDASELDALIDNMIAEILKNLK